MKSKLPEPKGIRPELKATGSAQPPKPPAPQVRVVRLAGLGEWSPLEHRLGAAETSVGNDPASDLAIDHPTVSRKHAILRQHNGHYTVADLGSTNGTFVNGYRITQRVPVTPGDELSFGSATFAMLGGTGAIPAPRRPRRRSGWRTIAGVAGIALFAAAGFIGARYALEWERVENPSAQPSREAAQPSKPVTRPREVAEATAEISSSPAAPDLAEVEAPAPIWLTELNDFRGSVNLAPVVSNEKLTDGDQKHAAYLLKNFSTEIHEGVLGPEVHSEDPSNDGYTPEGDEAAHASDIAEQGAAPGRKLSHPLDWAIEGWIIAPFHRLPMLSPLLHEVGFAYECEENSCVALLNVLGGAEPMPRYAAPLEHPILFPPDGAAIPSRMRALTTEWPNPLSGCDGYVFPAGFPISVQLGPMVEAQLNSFSITRDGGGEVESCGFDSASYYNSDDRERSSVVNNLRGQGAIIIVPRSPLDPGTRYDVAATINGRDYKWSFSVTR